MSHCKCVDRMLTRPMRDKNGIDRMSFVIAQAFQELQLSNCQSNCNYQVKTSLRPVHFLAVDGLIEQQDLVMTDMTNC